MTLVKMLSKSQGLDINYKIMSLSYIEMTSWEELIPSLDSIHRFRSKLNLEQVKKSSSMKSNDKLQR